jgi:predicted N-acyltransferase
VTFCTEGEARDGEAMGLMRRASQQFHWLNDGYAISTRFSAR